MMSGGWHYGEEIRISTGCDVLAPESTKKHRGRFPTTWQQLKDNHLKIAFLESKRKR
jgi:hypothetical protein